MAQQEFRQIFPQPGWVEHHPQEIWTSQASVIAGAIASAGINGLDIAAIGITNQRETTIVWDRETGQPVYNAIVWQDRRTASYCDALKAEGKTEFIREKTGLIIDAYFSATKVKWILDHVEGAREKAEAGKLIFGTVDSWLVWKLTRGEVHVTDVTNASRTMLYNIRRGQVTFRENQAQGGRLMPDQRVYPLPVLRFGRVLVARDARPRRPIRIWARQQERPRHNADARKQVIAHGTSSFREKIHHLLL